MSDELFAESREGIHGTAALWEVRMHETGSDFALEFMVLTT